MLAAVALVQPDSYGDARIESSNCAKIDNRSLSQSRVRRSRRHARNWCALADTEHLWCRYGVTTTSRLRASSHHPDRSPPRGHRGDIG